MPGQSQHTLESLRKEAVEIAERGRASVHPLRRPGAEGPGGLRGLEPRRDRSAGDRGAPSRVRRRRGRDRRPLPRRVHRPRALRRAERARRGRERRDRRALPADRDRAGEGGRPPRRAERDDGRAGGRDPRRPRRRRTSGHRDPRVRGEVRLRALRAVPRSRRGRAALRRPHRLPAGSRRTSTRRSARSGPTSTRAPTS